MNRDFIENVIAALSVEIEEVEKNRPTSKTEIENGKLIEEDESWSTYSFFLFRDIRLFSERVIVTVNEEQVKGKVTDRRKNMIFISLKKNMGKKIPRAYIEDDITFLLKELLKRYETLSDEHSCFNHEKANQVLEAKGKTLVLSEDEISPDSIKELNKRQSHSIRKALGSDTLFIWGPPGTGKTLTLSKIAEEFHRRGVQILVVSNTNNAVDNLLYRICENLETQKIFHEGSVLRIGPIMSEELKKEYGNRIDVDKLIEKQTDGLKKQVVKIENQIYILEGKVKKITADVAKYEKINPIKEEIRLLVIGQKHITALLDDVNNYHSRLVEIIREKKVELTKERNKSGISKLFSFSQPSIIKNEIKKCESRLRGLNRKKSELIENLDYTNNKIINFEKKRERFNLDIDEGIEYQNSLFDSKKKLRTLKNKKNKLKNKLKKENQEVKNNLFKNCKIFASTVYKSYLSELYMRNYACVIIDEASMLNLPLTYYVSGLASRHVVIAGDFRQLGPISATRDKHSKSFLVDKYFKKDIFVASGIVEKLKSEDRPSNLVALKEQYRMNEDVCSMISNNFYSEIKLKTSFEPRNPKKLLFTSSSLSYFDTSRFMPKCVHDENGSRINIFHALACRNIVHALYLDNYIPKVENEIIGVTSPFKAQIKIIRKLVEEIPGNPSGSFVSNVHKYEGKEKETMIYDLTDSYDLDLSFFTRANELEEDGVRLLNVALSRARENIILVANFKYLLNKLSEQSPYRSILNHFVSEGKSLDIDMILSLSSQVGSKSKKGIVKRANNNLGLELFDEKTFYPAFRKDLENAKENVVICSPFLSHKRISYWMEYLKPLISSGVKISVRCRRPEIYKESRLIDGLKESGIEVIERENVHGKIAVIDDIICYIGSLNILSHFDAEEWMVRTTNSIIADQLLQRQHYLLS